ncbi:MAG: S1C family serine protease [Candidatus Limnocylindrales bacterium]
MKRILVLAAAAAMLAGCGATTVVETTPAPLPSSVAAPIVLPVSPAPSGNPAPSGDPAPSSGPGGTTDLIAATVQVLMYHNADDPLEAAFAAGSGTIISADGLILTNSHVAAPDAPGLAVQYGDPSFEPVGKLVIMMTVAEDQRPVPTYQASLVAADGYLDVAVIRIDRTADGAPVSPGSLNLPYVEIGDSDAVHIGDQVTIIGFPSIGGDTITVAKGDVSGFVGDERIGDRSWIKTSAIVYHGNSGGLAANDKGQLVGIPTRIPDFGHGDDVGGFSLVRPAKLALPVVDAARAGQAYGPSPYIVAGTGQEQVQLVGWLVPEATDCSAADPNRVLPIGTNRLAGGLAWAGFTKGEDVLFAWLMKNGNENVLLSSTSGLWPNGASGDCAPISLTNADGFPEGAYTLVFFAGPNLRQLAAETVTTGQQQQPPTGVVLTGRILDTTTGNGIPAAAIFALLPGTDVRTWAQNATTAEVAAYAETGADGSFTLNAPLTPGTPYPLLIVAEGYQPLIGTLTPGTDTSAGEIGLAPVQ